VLAHYFGSGLLRWLERWNATGWAVLLLVLGFVGVIRLATRLADAQFRRRIAVTWGRWTRWEFWPAWWFYLPVALNYLRLALRFRGLTLHTAANPGILSGGFVGESKIVTLRDLHATSPEFTAEAHLLDGSTPSERLASLRSICDTRRLDYPLVLKPDVGQRGVGVKLVRTPDQAAAYLRGTSAPLVVQRYAPGPHEAGVFYYRFRMSRADTSSRSPRRCFPRSPVTDGTRLRNWSGPFRAPGSSRGSTSRDSALGGPTYCRLAKP
jgi:hypothetical protein